jgi:hypothetical protein
MDLGEDGCDVTDHVRAIGYGHIREGVKKKTKKRNENKQESRYG